MKKFITLAIIFSCFSAFAQDSIQHHNPTYISLSAFKEMGETLTKEDSLTFLFRRNDTLVLASQDFLRRYNESRIRTLYEPKDSVFLDLYKQVVFGTQLKKPANTTIKIWKDDVRILFDSTVPQEHKQELLEFAAKISSGIDSLNIVEASSKKDANFFIFYRGSEDEFDHEPRITKKVGGYYINWNEKQQLYRGVIKINTYEIGPETQKSHLKYHFVKSLGYFYHSTDLPCDSYFSDCPVNRTFSEIDHEILKYHYSYGMCKGIGLEVFEKFHRDMKEKLAKNPDARLYLVHKK